MGKSRIIFYSIFGFYELMAFIFTVVIDADSSALFEVAKYIASFKYLSLVGVTLVAIDFVWAWRIHVRTKNEAEEFRLENNTLKARIYDFQESRKSGTPESK